MVISAGFVTHRNRGECQGREEEFTERLGLAISLRLQTDDRSVWSC